MACRTGKPLSPAQLIQRKNAGLALYAKRGRVHMQEIGAAGYWSTAARYGYDIANKQAFGISLSKAEYRRKKKNAEIT